MNEIVRIQGTALKRIFNVPISASYIGLIMETGTWPANQRIQYSVMMLYHNIMNSDHQRVVRKIIAEQAKSNHNNTMISKVKQIAEEIGLKIKNVENMSRSKWKKQVKEKIGKSIGERTKHEMANKTKARTIVQDKWKRNKYFQECDSDTIKDVIKIRLHMWQVNQNYKRDNTDTKCLFCQKSEDTTENVLECEKAKKFTLSKENNKEEWEEITEIYRKNKNKRELAAIKVQDQKIGRKYRKEEQMDKNDNGNNNNNNNNNNNKNKTHTQMRAQKDKKKTKGNRIEDRKRMKVEKSKEGKQKTKKETEAERKIRW